MYHSYKNAIFTHEGPSRSKYIGWGIMRKNCKIKREAETKIAAEIISFDLNENIFTLS
jgi:hypothetical protein